MHRLCQSSPAHGPTHQLGQPKGHPQSQDLNPKYRACTITCQLTTLITELSPSMLYANSLFG